MPHDTAGDTLRADARLRAVLDDFVMRLRAGRPARWYRLMHPTVGQLHASPDLEMVTQKHWQYAQDGIMTTIVHDWLRLDAQTP